MASVPAASLHVRPTQGEKQLRISLRERRKRTASYSSPQESHENVIVLPEFSRDWAVVQRAIAGDADSQRSLFAPYTTRLYRTAFAVLRNREDAEDAVQDGFCKAFMRLSSFQGRSSLSTWLTSIVRNAALMSLRKKRSRPEVSLDECLEGESETLTRTAVDERPDPEQICATGEIRGLMEKEIYRLTPALQTALRLRIAKAHSTAELGRSLGISAAAFKSRISRARRQLAGGLQRSAVNAASACSL